ncbi:hypothetical protein QBC44DRAFT_331051 [Cladorrhinum sp. PSN332]|nr:hypothetical protein QBC44DRAFT_331051 [Cladorrhinum sp. PSN332]
MSTQEPDPPFSKQSASQTLRSLATLAHEIGVRGEAAMLSYSKGIKIQDYTEKLDEWGMGRLQSRAWMLRSHLNQVAEVILSENIILTKPLTDVVSQQLIETEKHLKALVDIHTGAVQWFMDRVTLRTFQDMVASYSMMWIYAMQIMQLDSDEKQIQKMECRAGKDIVAQAKRDAEKAWENVEEAKTKPLMPLILARKEERKNLAGSGSDS